MKYSVISVVAILALSTLSCGVSAQIRDPCNRIGCGRGRCVAPADRPFCICEYGFRFDPRITTCVPNDSPICTACGIDECGLFPPDVTPYTCPFGFKLDECGCVDPSDCSCERCPPFDRTLQCELGFKIDQQGCPMSECMVPMTSCPPCGIHECGLFPPGVTPYSCPNGFAKDSCGCVSSCQCEGCQPFDANLVCPYGYRTRRGCPASVCNTIRPPPSARRCPRTSEPLGPVGRPCSRDEHCKATNQLCCQSINTSKSCLNGVPKSFPSGKR